MRLIRAELPLATFATCIAMLAAADVFGQTSNRAGERGPHTQIVASGRFLNTRSSQDVVTWKSRGIAYLAVQTRESRPRVLWQTDSRIAGSRVESVRTSDLDGDGTTEILSLWRDPSSHRARLRAFRWDPSQKSFIELQTPPEIEGVNSYRIVGSAGKRRLMLELPTGGNSRPSKSAAYELSGLRLVRVGGEAVTGEAASGIEGQAIISPARPGPIRQGMSNSAPYKTTLVVWRGSGDQEIKRFETGADGRFRVSLPPGTYRVGSPPQSGRFLPRGTEENVTVVAGRYTQVTINFDSGMR